MSNIIDRRRDTKSKAVDNRKRFLDRHKGAVKDAIKKSVSDKKIKDLGEDPVVVVPGKGISEPEFANDHNTGSHGPVVVGNKDLITGEEIETGEGGGQQTGHQGDDFFEDVVMQLDRKEFIDMMYEGWELPNFVKKAIYGSKEVKYERAGFTSHGAPVSLHLIRTYKNAVARKIAIEAGIENDIQKTDDPILLEELKKQKENIPFIDDVDLKFVYKEPRPQPINKAVIFFVMDVSGSVTPALKDLAKRLFYLIYLFLTTKYDEIELVFIRHTENAEEVSEQDFFNNRLSGGTAVRPALELVKKIGEQRYPLLEYNYYVVQSSDGDMFGGDAQESIDFIKNKLLPICQYYIYVELLYVHTKNVSDYLLELQEMGMGDNPNVSVGALANAADVYPTCKNFFKNSKS